MNHNLIKKWPLATILFVCLLVLTAGMSPLQAQSNSGTIQGTVTDQSGQAIQGASVAVISPSQQVEKRVVTGSDGKFVAAGLPLGTYNVQISAAGFSTNLRHDVVIAAEAVTNLPVALTIASVSEEVTVEADASTSLATEAAPVKALIDMASPRTEITSQYIREYTSPVTDFADITQAAPGTVSYATNGVGNGQSKTWFRGFSDGAFTMTWDGVPFQDSNDPTHHSWAYVPAPAISYVDFDRSPGTASDIGPTNFAGSIHMFSPKMGDAMTIKLSESYGSWNTNQILGEFNSGLFLHGKANLWFEGHHNSSDGYQTFNDQQRTAGTLKFNYKFSDRTNLTLVGTSVLVDSNTPDSDPTRQQIADHSLNYIMDGNQLNPDGTYNSMYYKNYTYHVPTNFEVITFTKEFAHNWKLETKPYTYSYSNHQHLQKDQSQDLVAGHVVAVSATSAVDKLNQYNRGGEITTLSGASKYGVFRTGAWFEYTTTHRYQVKSDPRTWTDSPLLSSLKFHEYFITKSTQPYIEYQLVAIPKWTITAGLKSATYTMNLNQLADGSTVGNLGCTSTTIAGCAGISARHSAFYNNILPSFEANYRIRSNWSVYGQYGRGSEIPPSNIFDTTGAQTAVTPNPTVATTYQGGTVVQLNRLSFDADVYHIHFDNAYSSFKAASNAVAPLIPGDTYFYSTPPSNTLGFEAEGNLLVSRGLSLNFNGTAGHAKYEAAAASTRADGAVIPATPSAWVAAAPNYTVGAGVTYSDRAWDLGFLNKQIGPRYVDNSGIHQATQLNSFWMNNLFANYTIRRGSFFDQSKIKLSINNLFDFHDVVGLSPGVGGTSSAPYVVSGLDQLQTLPGRSIMITFQFGLAPRER